MDTYLEWMILNINDDIWEGRYHVAVEVEKYRVFDTFWTVRMYIYNGIISAIDPITKFTILEYCDTEYPEEAYFTFSEKQADDLVSYINSLKGFKALKLQAYKQKVPKERFEFLKWILVDPNRGEVLHIFSNDENYPLEFSAIGVFDVNLAVRTGPLTEKQLWFEIERALEPLPVNEKDRLLQLSFELVKENVDRK